jgi:uncharacterized membrane protein YcaP (DUF421 family)
VRVVWHDIWVLQVPWWERILRAVVVYAFVVVALRLAGKRELGQLNSLDLVVLLFLSNILQNSIIGNDVSITGGIIGAATLLLVNYATIRVLFLFPAIDRVVEGDATVLVENGQLISQNLKKELLTEEELIVACHKQGLYSLDEVERAYLEPGGAITIFARRPTAEERETSEIEQRLETLIAAVQRIEARLGAAG